MCLGIYSDKFIYDFIINGVYFMEISYVLFIVIID